MQDNEKKIAATKGKLSRLAVSSTNLASPDHEVQFYMHTTPGADLTKVIFTDQF